LQPGLFILPHPIARLTTAFKTNKSHTTPALF
jgi:hypothetical protein